MSTEIGRKGIRGLAIGATATVALCLLHFGGGLKDFEDWAYDMRMRRFNTIEESSRIVHVDLTDQTFDLVAPWPWPRRLTADLIRTLHELGADCIALDIEFKRSKDARRTVLGEVIDDDAELAAAIADAGHVYVPLSFKTLPPDMDLQSLRRRAREIIEADPDLTADEFTERIGSQDHFGQQGLLRLRIGERLRESFGLSSAEIARRLGVTAKDVEDLLTGVKRTVAQELVAECARSNPDADLAEIQRRILGDESKSDSAGADGEHLREAWTWWRGMQAVLELASTEIALDGDHLPNIVSPRPPLEALARSAAGTGSVALEGSENVVRRTPLLLRYGDHVFKQLGFAVACRALGIEDQHIRVTRDGVLEFPDPRRSGTTWRIQLDERGQALINWSPGAQVHEGQAAWLDSFEHVPAARIMEIPQYRRLIDENERRWLLTKARIIERTRPYSVVSTYWKNIDERNELLRGPRDPKANRRIAQLTAEIEAEDKTAADFVALNWAEYKEFTPSDAEEQAEFEFFRDACRDVVQGELRRSYDSLGVLYRAKADQRAKELRPLIEGKICLIGYTASAIADMKPTPVYGFAPGVMVYSNIINEFLAGRIPRYAPQWVNLSVTLVCGLAIAWAASSLPAVASALIWLALSGLFTAINVLIYRQMDVFVVFVAPLAAMLAAWGVVTAYRQLTEERERRRFSKALAQYVSPAVARRLAHKSDRLDMSPVAREVTCFFSDLKGFTTLSERLGAEKTRAVLNPYLEAMSDVLHRHDAMINKFMGDGIFAFFNAPIFACEQHARLACESALASFEALEQLKANPPPGTPAEELAHLSMRIGLSTGTVFVGDYGSDTKLDYTAIGDSVNLAARLEPANKAFGTSIAVAEPTWKLAGNGFTFRRLGLIQVVGKTEGVAVFELMGRAGNVPQDRIEHAELFEKAIAALGHRDFDTAAKLFRDCLSARPMDACAGQYLKTLEELQTRPRGDDWKPTIELTSK